MKDKIKEVQDYFIKKLKDGDFVVEHTTSCTATVIIDETYRFKFLLISEMAVKEYDDDKSFMQLNLTNTEGMVKPLYAKINEYMNNIGRETKLKEIERLKTELGI